MRFVQHKKEAYWFYRFLSLGYDDWVNPLFWTPQMRERALAAARLDDRGLKTLDAGAGTGFTTEGIVAQVDPARRDDARPEPAPARARRAAAPRWPACARMLGDAEALPFQDDAFDRYVSAGSIEYWPDPQRGIAEAYRVLRPGGVGVVIGPVRPGGPARPRAGRRVDAVPGDGRVPRAGSSAAGFADVTLHPVAPDWYRDRRVPYAVAVSGVKPRPGPSPLALAPPAEDVRAPLGPLGRVRVAARFAAGSLAGLAFVPIALAMTLRARWERR